MDSLGHLVLEWRTLSGLSQAELAQRVGGKVKAAHIGQLESVGNRMPRYLPDLARAMGCTVDDLLALRLPPPLMADAGAEAEGSTAQPGDGARFEISEGDAELLEAVKLLNTEREQLEIVERARALMAKAQQVQAARGARRRRSVEAPEQEQSTPAPSPARRIAR